MESFFLHFYKVKTKDKHHHKSVNVFMTVRISKGKIKIHTKFLSLATSGVLNWGELRDKRNNFFET